MAVISSDEALTARDIHLCVEGILDLVEINEPESQLPEDFAFRTDNVIAHSLRESIGE